MHAATDGIFVLLRGTTFLAAAILGVFAAVLKLNAHAPDVACAQDATCNRPGTNDVARNEKWPLVLVMDGNSFHRDHDDATTVPSDFVSEEFKVARHGKWPIIPVTIDGKDYPFVVDTGCSECIVDQTLQAYLAPMARTGFTGRSQGSQLCCICKAYVGKARLPVVGAAVCADLSWLRGVSHCEFYGILGMTFLKAFVLQIDFEAGKLLIRKSGPEPAPGALRLEAVSERPTLGVQIWSGMTEQFILDTGMSDVAVQLEARVIQTLEHEGRFGLIENNHDIARFHGPTKGRVGTVDRIRIAHFENTCLNVVEGPVNMLGLSYLSQFQVTFDFPRKSVYLERANDADTCRFDMSGLWIARVRDATIVRDVRRGSPAHSAGLQAGDRILRFGETDSNKFGLVDISELLSKERRRLSLVVERNDVSRTVEFELTDWQRTPVVEGTTASGSDDPAPELARDSSKLPEGKENVGNVENPD